MRYLLILMGAMVVALAVKMASENLWWIALPDAFFGLGVAWMAGASLHGEHHPHALPPEAAPVLAPEPKPTPPAPALPAPVQARTAEPAPARTKKKRKRR